MVKVWADDVLRDFPTVNSLEILNTRHVTFCLLYIICTHMHDRRHSCLRKHSQIMFDRQLLSISIESYLVTDANTGV